VTANVGANRYLESDPNRSCDKFLETKPAASSLTCKFEIDVAAETCILAFETEVGLFRKAAKRQKAGFELNRTTGEGNILIPKSGHTDVLKWKEMNLISINAQSHEM
jgi:hypothetical protein